MATPCSRRLQNKRISKAAEGREEQRKRPRKV